MQCTYNHVPDHLNQPVIVILGATATGKSGLALQLASDFDLEIISADSRYLYRGMNIGTAKPSREELALVPHHLVDIADPWEVVALPDFLDAARAAIDQIRRHGKLPVVAGGTPLYHRALLEGWQAPRVPPNQQLRDVLANEAQNVLFQRVEKIDPSAAVRIGPRNARRLIRAIEVYEATGRPLSELERKEQPPYDVLLIGLRQDRELLYERIDRRVAWMFGNGILDEARRLLDIDPSLPAMSAIGYPEARGVISGEIELDEAISRTCYATHRYVRHQATWFRRFDAVNWLDSSYDDTIELSVRLIEEFLHRRQ